MNSIIFRRWLGVALIAFTITSPGFSQEKSAAKPVGPAERLHGLKDKLMAAQKSAALKGNRFPVFFIEAKARIREAQAYIAQNPKAKNFDQVIMSCSLLVAASQLEFDIARNREKMDALHHEKDAVLKKLNQTYRDINHMERTYASGLKQDLSDSRRKALEEQEKARKLREEMESKFQELQSDVISVKKDARGTILSMSDILFDTGKSDLKGDLKTNLAKIAGILTVYKKSDIVVEGHTDNVGAEEYNQKLSEERALNVCNFLIDQGIVAKRISYQGFGLSVPVADNSTKEGRAQNRRVDIVIKDKPKKKK